MKNAVKKSFTFHFGFFLRILEFPLINIRSFYRTCHNLNLHHLYIWSMYVLMYIYVFISVTPYKRATWTNLKNSHELQICFLRAMTLIKKNVKENINKMSTKG